MTKSAKRAAARAARPRVDPWQPDIDKRMTERETSFKRKYRGAFMAKHNTGYCASCRFKDTDHCAMRSQLYAWRGEGDCWEAAASPAFQPHALNMPTLQPRSI